MSRAPTNETPSEHRQAVRQLDGLRFSFPLRAREEGEALLAAIIDPPDGIDDTVVLCEVLAALGSIERTLNNFPLAAAYLRRALQLALIHGLAKQEADLYQRCGYLMRDQGDFHAALASASEARERYTLLHDLPGIGKCLVDQGNFYLRVEERRSGISCYKAALLYLPLDLWRFRITAYDGLGWAYFELGRRQTAQRYLEHAYREHKTREGYSWCKLSWLRGELALARQELESAESAFKAVLEVFAIHDNAVDVALISLRLLQIFLLLDRRVEFKNLVSDMLLLLEPLRQENVIAESVVNDIVRQALAENVTTDFLDHAYIRLKQAA